MSYITFYTSMAAVLVIFAASIYFRPLSLSNIIIGIASTAYSLVYDVTLGNQFGLFHYINPRQSTLFMVMAAVFMYPLLNIIYTLFLPQGRKAVLAYTGLWIAAMLLFEYLTVVTGTIVFTGWRPVPWSLVTYIVTYSWVYFFYRHLSKKCTWAG